MAKRPVVARPLRQDITICGCLRRKRMTTYICKSSSARMRSRICTSGQLLQPQKYLTVDFQCIYRWPTTNSRPHLPNKSVRGCLDQRDSSDNVPPGHRGASGTFIYAFTLSYYLMINTNFTARARLHHATALFALYNSPAIPSLLSQPHQKTFCQHQNHTSLLLAIRLQSHSHQPS